jgi:hypothetical protein
MPYPSLTFAELLENSTRVELEQFVSLLQGYLSAQHNDDGSHTAITVSGDVTAEGDGTFDGNVTADADADGDPDAGSVTDGGQVIIGAFAAPGGAMNRGINGIDMRTNRSGSTISRWRIGASDGGGDVRDLLFQDLIGALAAYTFRVYWDTGTSEYAMEPIDVSPMRLGSDSTGERFTEIHGVIIKASAGYYERGRTAPVGEWTSRTGANFNAADFTASTGNWTVDSADAITYASSIVGKTMTVAFEIVSTDVSATPTELQMVIPGGFTAAKKVRNPVIVSDAGGAAVISYAQVAASGTVISVFPTVNGGNWTLTAGDNTAVIGQITFEVQ